MTYKRLEFPILASLPLSLEDFNPDRIQPTVLRNTDWTLGTKQISGHKLPLAYKSPYWYMTRLTRISTLHHTLVSLFRREKIYGGQLDHR